MNREQTVDYELLGDVFQTMLDEDLLEDRREYTIEDLRTAYELNDNEAKTLHARIQEEFDPWHNQTPFSQVDGETLRRYFDELVHEGMDAWPAAERFVIYTLMADVQRYAQAEKDADHATGA